MPNSIKIKKPPSETAIARPEESAVVPENLPVMPIRETVLFPGIIQPLTVGRERSLALVQDAVMGDRIFAVMAQQDAAEEEPPFARMYHVGCAVRILKLVRLPDENQTVIVQAIGRIRAEELAQEDPYYRADVVPMPDVTERGTELDALVISARELISRVIELSPRIPQEAIAVVASIESAGQLADFIAANLSLDVPQKQALLEEPRVVERLRTATDLMQREIEVLELASKIQSDARGRIEETQREYYLREQLKSIQDELGEKDEKTILIEQLRSDLDATGMPDEVRTESERELKRLEAMPIHAPDFNVVRTYLEYLAEMPWTKSTPDRLDLVKAEEILEHDHYGLAEPKKRILEFLAVRKLKANLRGPILCFVGPPGVGKTSLGRSIARAMARKFIRISLGGMRDEAEIRGHRRTYVGALPGRIILELRKCGVNNPVFMLDEVDKLGSDWRGDPTSALLEVLDPEQNFSFTDHYLDVPFDLSKVLFIATANMLDPVPPALKDRLEVINLAGYVEEEKLAIAKRYLVPRQRREHGMSARQIAFTQGALRQIIRYYTHEAGVRNLERAIAGVCRGVARQLGQGTAKGAAIKVADVAEFLGAERYLPDVKLRTSTPGVATGLAWTPAGGDILFVEATSMPGSGRLALTGQLGGVMKESAQAALSYIRSRADRWGIDAKTFRKSDLHIHVPAGATPKDGPSAGITLFAALTSLLTDNSIRSDVAMTGEITLRGLVLPVGGVKEKVLAAKRAGIKTVVLPERNRKDVEEIPKDIRRDMRFHYVEKVEEVLPLVLTDGRAPAAKKKRGGSRRKP
ncbi:MAG TPA: endopeptidase La [Phycisphaerae bacterium]|nr:endopeptidase La [Phycisphaerae bacterium]